MSKNHQGSMRRLRGSLPAVGLRAATLAVLLCGAGLSGCPNDEEPPMPEFSPFDDSQFDKTGIVFSNQSLHFGDVGFSAGEFEAMTSGCERYIEESFGPFEDLPPSRQNSFKFARVGGKSGNFEGVYNAVISAKASINLSENYTFNIKLEGKTRQPKPNNLFERCLTWHENTRGEKRGEALRDAYLAEVGVATVEVRRLLKFEGTIEGGRRGITYGEAHFQEELNTTLIVTFPYGRWRQAPSLKPLTAEDMLLAVPKFMRATGSGALIGTLSWRLNRPHPTVRVRIEELEGLYIRLSTTGSTSTRTALDFDCSDPSKDCGGDINLFQYGTPGEVEGLTFRWNVSDDFGTLLSDKVESTLLLASVP